MERQSQDPIQGLRLQFSEFLTLHMDNQGRTEKASVEGCVRITCYTECAPKMRIFFNDDFVIGRETQDEGVKAGSQNSILDYCTFHECVRFTDWEDLRCIEFLLPEKNFILFHYSCSSPLPTFRIFTSVEEGPAPGNLDCIVKIIALYPPDKIASEVTVTLPVPIHTITGAGDVDPDREESIEYISEEKKILWKIENFSGASETSARIRLNIDPHVRGNHKKELGPVCLKFEIYNYSSNVVQIKKLLILESKEPLKRYVRYLTCSKSVLATVDTDNVCRAKLYS
eukprot:TRINITY_DN8799_c0_g1_i10.p1 TRINITY_DN8799_c0_g1~~TRINITY_DN8799_c0_g1_i10.p1  ORF type:complete len:284 (-),score=59.31 TRINITY_DN8799_c0_g1_i10:105-956(-)